MACLSTLGVWVKNTNYAATAEDVMDKMAASLSAPFSLSTGICSCFEFHGGRDGGGETATDPLRAVIKKQPFVCTPGMEFFSMSWKKLIPGRATVIKIKCPPLHKRTLFKVFSKHTGILPSQLRSTVYIPWSQPSFKINSCLPRR